MNFTNESQITSALITGLSVEANLLAGKSEFQILNHMDKIILNEDMQSYLSSTQFETGGAAVAYQVEMNLNSIENARFIMLSENLKQKFASFKIKVKQVFCLIAHEILNHDYQALLKAAILALIPVFSGGLAALALPILVGLIALLIKNGINAVCPL